MDGTKKAWDDVGERFSEVGHVLREHYRSLGEEGEAGAAQSRERLSGALRTLVDELDRAFTAVGDTIRDPAASARIEEATRSLGDALASTFSDVGEEIRKAFSGRSRRSGGAGA